MIPVAKANPAKPLVPALYLAGKIGKNDWRHPLIPGLRERTWSDGPIITPTYEYVGPFFVACSHGCAHGPNSHGVIGGEGCFEIGYASALGKRIIVAFAPEIDAADFWLLALQCHAAYHSVRPCCLQTIFADEIRKATAPVRGRRAPC